MEEVFEPPSADDKGGTRSRSASTPISDFDTDALSTKRVKKL
jgi:hypothetical protein